MLHPGLHAAFEQVARGASVVAVVLERVGDGFRHDDVRGEVQHAFDLARAQQHRDHVAVGRVADHEVAVQHGRAEAGREVVEHDDVLAALTELANHVAADVAGAAGDEDGAHACSALCCGDDNKPT